MILRTHSLLVATCLIGAFMACNAAMASTVDVTYSMTSASEFSYVGDDGYTHYLFNETTGDLDSIKVSGWNGVTANTSTLENYTGGGSITSGGDGLELYRGGLGLYRTADGETCTDGRSGCQHTVDNAAGTNPSRDSRFDYIALDFGSRNATLTGFDFGWINREGDYSVLRYTGGSDGSQAAFNGTGDSSTLNWSAFETVVNVGRNNTGFSSIASVTTPGSGTPLAAPIWLIGAYNETLAGSNDLCQPNCPDNLGLIDGFKLKKVHASLHPNDTPPGDVPVPATLALVVLGGLLLERRTKRGGR